MHRLGLEAALDDDIGGGEAGVAVAEFVLERPGDVGARRRTRLGTDVAHVRMQNGCARLKGCVDVDDPRQHLVIHLDQLEGLRCDRQ